jgi:transposase-like protein
VTERSMTTLNRNNYIEHAYVAGRTIAELSRELGINRTTIYRVMETRGYDFSRNPIGEFDITETASRKLFHVKAGSIRQLSPKARSYLSTRVLAGDRTIWQTLNKILESIDA